MRNFGLPVESGIALTVVASGSPADVAGLRANDVIVAVDGQAIANNGELLAILADRRPGQSVSIDYYRGPEKQTASVTLTLRP